MAEVHVGQRWRSLFGPRPEMRHGWYWWVAFGLYVLAMLGWLVFAHSFPMPDLVAIGLLGFAFLMARAITFLRDWSPFILLLLAYVLFTGLVTGLVADAHIQFPIDADRWLFHGQVPSVWLQARFWHPDRQSWYDYGAVLLYLMHFVAPLVLAFGLWAWRADLYWRFVAAFLLLCFAGFLTYLIFPVAPPWWAAEAGRLPHVVPVINSVRYAGLTNPITLASRYFKPNPVAAMPSLHAAFPVLVWTVLWRVFPRWGWAMVVYPLLMSIAVVYLGEHYVVDVLAGWVYALVVFAVVWGRMPVVTGRQQPVIALAPVTSESVPV